MRDYMADAPDDLGAAVGVRQRPAGAVRPGRDALQADRRASCICWTGDHEEGERVIAPIREVAQPVMDMVGPMPYAALQSMLDGGGPQGHARAT